MTETHENRLRRLRYRAWRRGFREHDFLMGTFADTRLADLDAAGLDAFEALLDQSDWDVYQWIVGQATPPPAHAGPVLEALRAQSFSVEAFSRPG